MCEVTHSASSTGVNWEKCGEVVWGMANTNRLFLSVLLCLPFVFSLFCFYLFLSLVMLSLFNSLSSDQQSCVITLDSILFYSAVLHFSLLASLQHSPPAHPIPPTTHSPTPSFHTLLFTVLGNVSPNENCIHSANWVLREGEADTMK